MKYSPFVERIAGEGAAAWAIHSEAIAAKARGEDVIVLSVGDPDMDTPAAVTDRAISALKQGDTHYVGVQGTPSLRDAIARHASHGMKLPLTAENVCVTAGAQNGLFFASLLLLQPGDEVIMPDPCYVTYEATVRAAGATPIAVPPRAGAGFRPDPDQIAARVTPRTRALLWASPNNPTGTVTSTDEARALAAIACKHDLWVISDEVYSGLTFGVEHVSIASLPGMAERTLTISSLSKSHAMTGWRCGWIIGPEQAIAHAGNLSLCMLYGLPGFVQQAAETALENADAISARMRDIYARRRDALLAALAPAPGIKSVAPDAGMFLMVDISATGMSANEFSWALLRETGVSALDATAFGPSAAGYVRLSFTLNEETLSEAGRRIVEFCRNHAAQMA
ncbi:aminotransferase class I/II-fold pyridoxal phosphate-dependent enzyme [Paracoccus sp. Z330]|uniref:aspartate transaminase n=1 Tax=Paracoccus onchidii TaxID=3017813 RepID=A0ABT4ZFY3_9RHOB|nr:aminotransferase class I/II-fold pyridoxal phosphate-dependent enzyme [Paracoccus onchidii]MDB6178286.1 aminotransferase class I/II-fold pyridoxal phosphate-dependent enzyme [Paracoccus onchidii]